MYNLLTIKNNMAYIDSLTIADNTENTHQSVLKMVERYVKGVDFEIRPFETAGGTQKRRVALLDEWQSTFLITLFKNSDKVVAFKKALVQAYYDLRKKVSQQNQQASQWDSQSLSKLLITAGQELERKDLVIQHKNQVISTLAPKAEYYDKVQKMDEWCEMEVVAKQLCLVRNHKIMGRTNLYDYLRELGVIEQGTRRPYQQFVNNGFFKVVEKTWTDSYGKEHISYKTVVSPKGKDFILRTYKREEQTEGD